jgi:PTS system nitrogen regulatory IIA component
MRLAELVRPERVVANLKASGKLEVLDELAGVLAASEPTIEEKDFYHALLERERLRSTGVGSGVAIPHGKVARLDHLVLAVGLSRTGIDFDSADGELVHIFMVLAAPVNSTGDHLKALARIARLCSDSDFRKRLMACDTGVEAHRLLVSEDERYEG